MASKLATFLFFARRPSYYPEAIRRIRNKLGLALLPAPIGRSRVVAESWAAAQAVDTRTALRRVGMISIPCLQKDFPNALEAAEAARLACPVSMGGE